MLEETRKKVLFQKYDVGLQIYKALWYYGPWYLVSGVKSDHDVVWYLVSGVKSDHDVVWYLVSGVKSDHDVVWYLVSGVGAALERFPAGDPDSWGVLPLDYKVTETTQFS